MNRAFRLLALLTLLTLLLPPARADFSFVHVTDTHITATDATGSNADKVAALFREISAVNTSPADGGLPPARPAFVINTGDVCEIGTDVEYAVYQKTLANLTIPHYDAPGNHDVRWNPRGKEGFVLGTKQPLYQSWDYPAAAAKAGEPQVRVHFVLLDSTVLLQHWGHFDQAMLDWLKADLAKLEAGTPVIIGFHHWVGRDKVMVDNEQAFLDVIRPYNVRLLLIGHGHSDIAWNVDGIPAVMAKGLYQGSYNIVKIGLNRLQVLRRTAEQATPVEVLSTPLDRPASPSFRASVEIKGGQGTVTAARGDLPENAALAFRVNSGPYAPMTKQGDGWSAELSAPGLVAGTHTVTVRATVPDPPHFPEGRVYLNTVSLTLTGAASPTPAWTRNLGGAIQSRLVRHGDTLYVTTMGGDLVALDPANGAERWRVKTGGAVFSTPHVAGGTVYFGSADHFVYAVDAATGKVRWKTETGGAVFASAATAGGLVCIASVDMKIYGLDSASGKIVWTALGAGMYQSQAATDGERFFVGGWDNFFHGLDVKTGRKVWSNKFGKSFYFAPAIGSPTVGDGKVFVTSNDGQLHAMDAATGKLLWEVLGPSLGYSGPLFHQGRIYNASLTDMGRVFCFDANTGAKLWETPTGAVIYDSSCAWGGGNIYVGSVNGVFSALDASGGALRWQYRLGPGHVLASPATDDARVYIGSLSGQVTALPL